MPFPMTLGDLEGHSPNVGLIKCILTNICATFTTVLTDTARRAVPRYDSWASCLNVMWCDDTFGAYAWRHELTFLQCLGLLGAVPGTEPLASAALPCMIPEPGADYDRRLFYHRNKRCLHSSASSIKTHLSTSSTFRHVVWRRLQISRLNSTAITKGI